jgi:hypothetical protein
MIIRTSQLVLSRDLVELLLQQAVAFNVFEEISIASLVDPANHVNSTPTSDIVDSEEFPLFYFVLMLGACDTTCGFKLQSSIDGSSGWTDIPGKAIDPVFGASNDNQQAVIQIAHAEVPEGRRFLRAMAEAGAGTSCFLAVIGLGLSRAGGPSNLGSVQRFVP